MSEESHAAHEELFIFSCMQIATYIKHLKHTSAMYCEVGSGLGGGRGRGRGIIYVGFRKL